MGLFYFVPLYGFIASITFFSSAGPKVNQGTIIPLHPQINHKLSTLQSFSHKAPDPIDPILGKVCYLRDPQHFCPIWKFNISSEANYAF